MRSGSQMFEQTRVLNALLPPCALVAVAELVAERPRRLSVTECGRGERTYVPAESLNPPSPPRPAPRRSADYDAVVRHLGRQFRHQLRQVDDGKLRQPDDGERRQADYGERRQADDGERRQADDGERRQADYGERRQADYGERRQRDDVEPCAGRQRSWAGGDGPEPSRQQQQQSEPGPSAAVHPNYSHPMRKTHKFQSVDNMQAGPPPAAAARLRWSEPNLSSPPDRTAAPPAPRLVAPPPPRHPPPAEERLYDAPRNQPMSVSADHVAEEILALRRDNYQLRQMVQQLQTADRHTERREEGRRSGSSRPRTADDADEQRLTRRQLDSLLRDNDHLATANRRLTAENARLRAQPDREDSAVLRQLVVRLSEQLSRQLGRPPLPDDLLTQLTDTRRLPPLLEAYDQTQAELTEQADTLRADLSELRHQLQQLTTENERLHTEMADAQSKPGVTHHEWKAVSDNARLVLEENQLLRQQAQTLQDRQTELLAVHHQGEAELTARAAELDRTTAELRLRLQTEQSAGQQLQAERDRLQDELERHVPRDQHEHAVTECRRLFEELRGRYTSERLSLLADTEALQAERRRLVVQLTDAATQRMAAEAKLRAANKAVSRLERRLSSLQGNLDSAEKANSEASEHLAGVLSATDQLMAERSQLTRLSTTQLSGGDKLMERISEERADNLRLKDKVKAVRRQSEQQLDQLQFELGDQARSHEARVAEYERQIVYLRSRLNEKRLELDQAEAENRRVSQEMDTLSRAATAENQKLKQQLQLVPERDSSGSNVQ